MSKTSRTGVDRRKFLKGAALAGAATLAAPPVPGQAQSTAPAAGAAAGSTPLPTAQTAAAETGAPAHVRVLTQETCGSDFMVDCIKSLGIEYICSNPGSSFRSLQDSIITYGGNKSPEFIMCCHEESSVGMAHGYAKIEGKPAGVFAHGTVGLQHAAMGIYNAYCDRVPVYMVIGNGLDATKRRPGVEWLHTVQDACAMVRDFTKWDDTPASLQHFAESAVRAYKIATTPPMEPVVLVADGELQENPIPPDEKPRIPKLPRTAPPQGDSGAVAEAAKLLVDAENPVILADRCARTPAGIGLLVQLAEALQAPVCDLGGRMNFPSRHPLNQSNRTRALVQQADVILGIEMTDFWGATNEFEDQLHRTSKSVIKDATKRISLSSTDLNHKSNYQDFERFADVDVAITGDAEATLPALIEAVKRQIDAGRRSTLDDRGRKLGAAHKGLLERARADAAVGWDASPISTARMCMEVWNQIKGEDWSMVSPTGGVSRWPQRLWDFQKHYQHIGDSGGYGVGYAAPSSVGAALANRKYGRLTVSIQPDGDLMYAPGVLWTAAHHRIPMLAVMHNNRAYHQEVMHLQRMSNRRNRGVEMASVGCAITGPNIDYAKLAQSMGWYAEGPISDPKDLGPALQRAIAVVKRGEPAMVDVVTQPR
ncbi:MAG TPA: thiamine pyrophosphate-dependent enzyme [Alphaproteobacteria bacterium]